MVEACGPAPHQHRLSGEEVKREIEGFDTDDSGDWRAKLECRHYQHMRHDPPLRVREWVLSEEGRNSRLGQFVECKKCDQQAPRDFEN
jgi:hypothetical protein